MVVNVKNSAAVTGNFELNAEAARIAECFFLNFCCSFYISYKLLTNQQALINVMTHQYFRSSHQQADDFKPSNDELLFTSLFRMNSHFI